MTDTTDLPSITIYTDGGCDPNPGPGGWAAILLYPGEEAQELIGSEEDTSNNRMELRAALEALEALSDASQVTLYTDSEYLYKGMTQWLPGWKQRNWQTRTGEVKNRDLWEALEGATARHEVNWQWTRGHAGDTWNERADELARAAILRAPLSYDAPGMIHLFTAASYSEKHSRGGWGIVLRYGEHLDANTIQKLATRAYRAANEYAVGNRGRPRFVRRSKLSKPRGLLRVLPKKAQDEAGILYRTSSLEGLFREKMAALRLATTLVGGAEQAHTLPLWADVIHRNQPFRAECPGFWGSNPSKLILY